MISTNYFAEIRRKQKIELLENLKKRPKDEHDKICAMYCNHTGLQRKTIRKMYDELVEAGAI